MSDYEGKTESELKSLRSQLQQKIQDFQREIQKIDRCLERKQEETTEMTSMDILESIFPKMSMKSSTSKKKEESSDEEEETVKPKKKTPVGGSTTKKKATAKAKESDSESSEDESSKKPVQFGKLDTNKVTIDTMMKILNKNKIKYDTSTTKLRADFCVLVKKNSLIMECVALQKKENEKK